MFRDKLQEQLYCVITKCPVCTVGFRPKRKRKAHDMPKMRSLGRVFHTVLPPGHGLGLLFFKSPFPSNNSKYIAVFFLLWRLSLAHAVSNLNLNIWKCYSKICYCIWAPYSDSVCAPLPILQLPCTVAHCVVIEAVKVLFVSKNVNVIFLKILRYSRWELSRWRDMWLQYSMYDIKCCCYC